MKDSQDSKSRREIIQISSIEQLLASYLVAQCIIEIREERKHDMEKIAKETLPKLNVPNERYQKLYMDFAEVVNYGHTFIFLAKIGLEDMYKYKFSEDPSVQTDATKDTQHLQNMFSASFSVLAKINLEEHTLNVFEKGIQLGAKQGRIMQTAIPMLGCLFHDFGKSKELRSELLGPQVGRSYKQHAEVSGMYVRDVLAIKYHEKFKEHSMETIELLAKIVENHHTASRKLQNDNAIGYVINADKEARKEEMKKIKMEMIE